MCVNGPSLLGEVVIFIIFRVGSRAATGGVTCVFCRTEWVTPSTSKRPATAGVRTSEGYVNLANVAGVSTMRDTSSCKCHRFETEFASLKLFKTIMAPQEVVGTTGTSTTMKITELAPISPFPSCSVPIRFSLSNIVHFPCLRMYSNLSSIVVSEVAVSSLTIMVVFTAEARVMRIHSLPFSLAPTLSPSN